MKSGFVQRLKKEVAHLQTLVEQKSSRDPTSSENSVGGSGFGIADLSINPREFYVREDSHSSFGVASFNTSESSLGLESPLEESIEPFDTSAIYPLSLDSAFANILSASESSSILNTKETYVEVEDQQQSRIHHFSNPGNHIRNPSIASSRLTGSSSGSLPLRVSNSTLGVSNSTLGSSEEAISKSKIIIDTSTQHMSILNSANTATNQSFKSDMDKNIGNWTILTFFVVNIKDQAAKDLSFIDSYFQKVWPIIPVFSKGWLFQNLSECPLWLLHAMYGLCLVIIC